MKGVSPIIGTVLLIAITVFTGVGLWYYVTEIASNEIVPPGSGQVKELKISSCSASGLYAVVRNTGVSNLDVNADIFNASGTRAGVLNFTSRQLTVGEVDRINISKKVTTFTAGTYRIFDENFSEVTFTCS